MRGELSVSHCSGDLASELASGVRLNVVLEAVFLGPVLSLLAMRWSSRSLGSVVE